MTAETWGVIKSVFGRALEISARRRRAWIDEQGLASEVRREAQKLVEGVEPDNGGESKGERGGPGDEPPQFSAGQVIMGRFEILEFLGKGGMGEVYAAFDSESLSKVALKTVSATLGRRPEVLDQTRHEMRTARQVSHGNVCRVFDVHRHEEQIFLTMELLEGETLQQRASRGVLDEAETMLVLEGILNGLEAIHQAGIVHRDLKSSNVMLVGEGPVRPVILDFGLARNLSRSVLETGTLFEDGAIVGTPAYMAPEQLRGEGATERSDLYALGVILFQALTGELPFPGKTPLAVALMKVQSEAPRLREARPDLNPRWDRLVGACLEGETVRRPASVGEAREILAGMRRPTAAKWTRRQWAWGGFATVAAVGAFGVFRWQRRHVAPAEAIRHAKRGEEFARRRTAENVNLAIAEYREAIAMDSQYADAWAGLADAYAAAAHFVFLDARLARVEAGKAAEMALSLDAQSPKAHSALAYVRSNDLNKWRDAEGFFRQAIDSFPEEPLLHVWYAAYLGRVGRHEQAIAEANVAIRLDPASMGANHQLAVEYFRAGQLTEYVKQAREIVKIQPLEASGHLALTRALEWTKDFTGAEEELKLARLYGSAEKARSFEGTLRAAQGRREEALAIAAQIRKFWETKHLETNILAGLYGSLGLADKVAEVLEAGYAREDTTVLAAATNPYLRGVKQSPRVEAFLKRLGY